MEWLVEIHDHFELLPETLFLAVNYFDRFLSCSVVSLKDYSSLVPLLSSSQLSIKAGNSYP
jgi:hypothetical protein